ncbi:hypothetical protein [Paenibacillus sp. GCM10023250]|uniref:hypothetical protein n=1 Tax=Paenibacillus sp. GCM10023250 TaxID=3252648 RepID=UPI00360DA2D9
MEYIVFDMEFSVVKKVHEAEILEIGAIKLSDEDGTLEWSISSIPMLGVPALPV